jgi:hypothetical protein
MRSLTLAAALLALGVAPVLAQVPDKPAPTPPVPEAKPAPTPDQAEKATPAQPAAQDLQWAKAPPMLPDGAEIAVVKGDPTKPGAFTIRLRLPDGYRIAPHTHPTDENITVVSGILLLAHGENMRSAGPATLEMGAKRSMAAGTPHVATARGITIVEIESTGPFEISYVNQADDPRRTGS